MTLDFSRPGKPTDNAYVESFNGRLRDECLNANWFLSLEDAQAKIAAWRRDYNESRPHTALGHVPPPEFAAYLPLPPANSWIPATPGCRLPGVFLRTLPRPRAREPEVPNKLTAYQHATILKVGEELLKLTVL